MMLLCLYTQDYDEKVSSFDSYSMGGPEPRLVFKKSTWDAAGEETIEVGEGLGPEATRVRMTNNVRVYAIADVSTTYLD